MKNVQCVLANYSADLFGVCSALYELGGLCVMHDASGCNSTYNTHDEPRWYDIDSMVYVSGLTETDAVMGNDQRLIDDVLEAAGETHPKFIALSASPMPYMLGTDLAGIARIIEKRCGIPTFGFPTNGMHAYVKGAQMAFAALAERFCRTGKETADASRAGKAGRPVRVNLLGVTPLDFSVVGNVGALRSFFEKEGMEVVSCWAMGDTLETIAGAGSADVNAVVSSCGLAAADVLKRKFGTPYITGMPIGRKNAQAYAEKICRLAGGEAAADAPSQTPCTAIGQMMPFRKGTICIVGEAYFASSLRDCLETDFGRQDIRILCPTEKDGGILRETDLMTKEEDDFRVLLNRADTVIADPLYRRILKKDSGVRFISFPHEAYSGRLYRHDIPVFIGDAILPWLAERLPGQTKCGTIGTL